MSFDEGLKIRAVEEDAIELLEDIFSGMEDI